MGTGLYLSQIIYWDRTRYLKYGSYIRIEGTDSVGSAGGAGRGEGILRGEGWRKESSMLKVFNFVRPHIELSHGKSEALPNIC
jgi:hypothetical protein